jgi:uncharacterized membrane protein YgaE (UPF0421/DUF939 family)
MASWLFMLIVVLGVSFAFMMAAAILAPRRPKRDELSEIRDEVASLRDEVARLRRLVEDKGPRDSGSEAIRSLEG